MANVTERQETPVDRLKAMFSTDSVRAQMKNALAENAGVFTASVIDVFISDKTLQACSPKDVIAEALKAATLKLPLNKSLGFAYLVPYKSKPTFIVGYKGMIQLAMRTGFYKYLNAGPVYEGELAAVDKLTGMLDLSGVKKSDKITGYFGYLELTNGFKKAEYWTLESILKFAKEKSRAFNSGPWQTDREAMCIKTVLRHLIAKWGYMSIEMVTQTDREITAEDYAEQEIAANANRQTIDVEPAAQQPQQPKEYNFEDVGEIEEPFASADAPY